MTDCGTPDGGATTTGHVGTTRVGGAFFARGFLVFRTCAPAGAAKTIKL
jgi:hypothetical protein